MGCFRSPREVHTPAGPHPSQNGRSTSESTRQVHIRVKRAGPHPSQNGRSTSESKRQVHIRVKRAGPHPSQHGSSSDVRTSRAHRSSRPPRGLAGSVLSAAGPAVCAGRAAPGGPPLGLGAARGPEAGQSRCCGPGSPTHKYPPPHTHTCKLKRAEGAALRRDQSSCAAAHARRMRGGGEGDV